MMHNPWLKSVSSRGDREATLMTPKQEELIRRAIHHVIVCSRSDDRRVEVERVFDLFAFLPPEVQALIEDEAACTLGEIYGAI